MVTKAKNKIIDFDEIPPGAGSSACFPLELTTSRRDDFEEMIISAKCPKCGSSKLRFMDLGLDSPIQCQDCKEVY